MRCRPFSGHFLYCLAIGQPDWVWNLARTLHLSPGCVASFCAMSWFASSRVCRILMEFIYLFILCPCSVFIYSYIFWMRAYVSQLICHFGRIWGFLSLFSPLAPVCVLVIFVPGKFWDYLCPGIWDHLCPGNWDHLCPQAWDYLCPAFMELRDIYWRCQIVCVYSTFFFCD